MNIYDLRKCISVLNHVVTQNNTSIYYNKDGTRHWIDLTNEELFKELIAIGTYEDTIHDEREFKTYKMSQWDALNIVIRFELVKETEKELSNSDIFEALAKITKPNK